MFQFSGFNMIFSADTNRNFRVAYKSFPVSMLRGNERHDVENGGKIIMPPSALDTLTRHNVEYPMLFKLTNFRRDRISHCGVLEFVADEGKCYLPYWMMENLLLTEGDLVTVESISLPVAQFSKFQPHSIDFLDITNPKAVLENALRNFACLTTGDVIAIKYNKKVYELCVLETKPGSAVSIIECDMNVEFEAPVGYAEMEEERKSPSIEPVVEELPEPGDPFQGSGLRLDGKKRKSPASSPQITKKTNNCTIIPDYDYKFGLLTFDRSIQPISDRQIDTPERNSVDDFEGEGRI